MRDLQLAYGPPVVALYGVPPLSGAWATHEAKSVRHSPPNRAPAVAQPQAIPGWRTSLVKHSGAAALHVDYGAMCLTNNKLTEQPYAIDG